MLLDEKTFAVCNLLKMNCFKRIQLSIYYITKCVF